MIDLKTFFLPLKEDLYQKDYNWQSTQLGSFIQSYNLSEFPEYQFCEMAIFSVREFEGSEIWDYKGFGGYNVQSHRFSPFTYGPRNCLGKNFTFLTITITL